jgi:hypothetical protein
MRRSRRNGHNGLEFGGSGEDSFVAVVVTKLTGALLFILLLTMVIMALLPKAIDLPAADTNPASTAPMKLEIVTPETLPEAIAGRPYAVALAAHGATGTLHWGVDGKFPEGLTFDPESAQIRGTPKTGTPEPAELVVRVSDGKSRTSQCVRLVVYKPDQPLTLPSRWKPSLPPIPWQAWLEQGFGFLVLWLVHLVGMTSLANLKRWSLRRVAASLNDNEQTPRDELRTEAEALSAVHRRFFLYRTFVRLASLSAAIALALWLGSPRP